MSAAMRSPTASWIEAANARGSDFPVQNLPYGVFRVGEAAPRCGVAIGDLILDLCELEKAGLIDAGPGPPVFCEPALNAFMGRGKAVWAAVRARLTALLMEGGVRVLRDDDKLAQAAPENQPDAE